MVVLRLLCTQDPAMLATSGIELRLLLRVPYHSRYKCSRSIVANKILERGRVTTSRGVGKFHILKKSQAINTAVLIQLKAGGNIQGYCDINDIFS